MHRWAVVRERILSSRKLGFDLEGDFNLHRYGRRICLFQVSLEDGTAVLLDPLEHSFESESEFAEWQSVLEDPSIRKVIWAAQNDVRALKFCYGIPLRGLFDLFDAARLTGFPKPSLPLLASRLLGVELVKEEKWQTSDWNIRPLRAQQLAYAEKDVRYLLPLGAALESALDEKKQRSPFDQRMRAVEAFVYDDTDQPWRKVKGAGALLPKQQLKFRELWEQRENRARESNLAPWRVVANEQLLDQARAES
ncbi:MAG: hypothetical protein WCG80_01520 [Spirochaetales bacterium]